MHDTNQPWHVTYSFPGIRRSECGSYPRHYLDVDLIVPTLIHLFPYYLLYSLCDYWSAIRSAESVSLLFVSFASLWRQERPERNPFFKFYRCSNFVFFTELARTTGYFMYIFTRCLLSSLQDQARLIIPRNKQTYYIDLMGFEWTHGFIE